MTKLTDEIQAIGYVHKCESYSEPVYSISKNEAIKARELMKQKCIDAVMKSNYPANGDAIKAIMEIE